MADKKNKADKTPTSPDAELLADEKEDAPLQADRALDGDIDLEDEVLSAYTKHLTPEAMGANEGNVTRIWPTRFFKREQKKYNSEEVEDIVCCNFSTEEGAEENTRYHYKITNPVKDAFKKHYGTTNIGDLVGMEIKLLAVKLDFGQKPVVFRPIAMHQDQEEVEFK